MQRRTILSITVNAVHVELFQLNHTSGSSKQAWHTPDAVCTALELLMMGGETAGNMYSVDSNREYCMALHLVGCT